MNMSINANCTFNTAKEPLTYGSEENFINIESFASFRAMVETYIDNENLKVFINEAKKNMASMVFRPLTITKLRDYCKDAFCPSVDLKMNSLHEINIFDIRDLINMFGLHKIYAQRYIYRFANPRATIFILNTPTKMDFELGKEAIKKVIELFEKSVNNSTEFDANGSFEILQLRNRGAAKVLDIKVNGIFNSASVGIDFR